MRRSMQAFFGCMLEAMLKGAFIRRSGGPADNCGMPSLRAYTVMAGLLLGLAPRAIHAGEHGDHERARAAVQAGEVLPLAAVLERLQQSHPGQVLELELDREDGRWIYEIRLLQADGQLLRLDVDARTAQVLSVRRRHDPASQASRR